MSFRCIPEAFLLNFHFFLKKKTKRTDFTSQIRTFPPAAPLDVAIDGDSLTFLL